MLTIAVAGATGYAGSEILRLLLGHPGYERDFTIKTLAAGSSAGDPFGQYVPGMPELAERVIQPVSEDVLAEHDIVFLALPHGVSAQFNLPDSIVIDCAADYRLESAAEWEKYYGSAHAGTWTYGIPELPGGREKIADSTHVAVPGCFPTGATLALAPAMSVGLMSPEINVVSVTGVSGAGKKAATNLLGAEVIGSLRAYNVGSHRHTPEITQNVNNLIPQDLGDANDTYVTFTPILAPITRGILSTVTARALGSEREIRQAYEDYCSGKTFMELLPEGQQPEIKSVVGSNMVHIQVTVTDGMIIVTSAIDNLTKGTAGAAVQCMNIIQKWPETAGLSRNGL